jgi:hypothetical protein
VLEHSRRVSGLLGYTEHFLAYAYLSAGRHDQALDATLRADPWSVDPLVTLALRAQAYSRLHRFDEAAGAFRVVTGTTRGDTPDFWMLLARDLARGGHPLEARAAADTARARTSPATPVRAAVDRLAAAIERGCFDAPFSHSSAPPADSPCRDPLAGWPVVLPPGAQEVANPLQNAMGPGASAGAPADSGKSVIH